MSNSDKHKADPQNLPTIRAQTLASGAYPTAIVDGGDTDPQAIYAFDEAEDTRHDGPSFPLDVTDKHSMPPISVEDATQINHEDDGGWDLDDWDGYWMRVHAIEAAGNESDEALDAALRKHGLRDKAHFDEVREHFHARFGDDPAFMQAGLDARMKQGKQMMNARLDAVKGDLAPFEGVTLEQWAWLMAKIASGGNPAELLALAQLDDAKWQRVSAEWNARMSRDQTAAIATAYGQAFVASGPGPFAAAGRAVAGAMLNESQRGVGGGPPVPMERWIEISEAQKAAGERGEDPSALLASFGMTPADWGVVGGWWGQHFAANAMKLMGEYNRLSEHYRRKYAR